MHGIGIYAGLESIKVPGATGYLDTNYDGKVKYALKKFASLDFVYLHVEAPDETSHSGDLSLKIRAIEEFDRFVVGPVLNGMKQFDRFRVLLITDHFTPVSVRTHTTEPVPFVFFDSDDSYNSSTPVSGYNEAEAEKQGLLLEHAYMLMDEFIRP